MLARGVISVSIGLVNCRAASRIAGQAPIGGQSRERGKRALWRRSPSPAALPPSGTSGPTPPPPPPLAALAPSRASASPLRGARRISRTLASSRFCPRFKPFGALGNRERVGHTKKKRAGQGVRPARYRKGQPQLWPSQRPIRPGSTPRLADQSFAEAKRLKDGGK